MLLRQTYITWNQFRPMGKWMVVKEDPEQCVTAGGIFLTETRPMAADVGYFTGTVLKVGKEVEDALGINPLGLKICHRKYLADVIRFGEPHEDGCSVFLMKSDDVEAIVRKDIKINAI
jgi:co-chaperonin GroES (HSP10)